MVAAFYVNDGMEIGPKMAADGKVFDEMLQNAPFGVDPAGASCARGGGRHGPQCKIWGDSVMGMAETTAIVVVQPSTSASK